MAIATSPERRLVWDGKERWLVIESRTLETHGGLALWKDLWIKRAAAEEDIAGAIQRLLEGLSQDAT